MSSDLGRGIKFGIGFALGVGFVMTLFLFGLSMCAGHLHRRVMEQMEEMLPKERRPVPETQGDRASFQHEGKLLVLTQGGQAMAFAIRSTAFSAGGTIPKRYTCDGPDVSPPLSWTEPPAGTKSLALIMDDPDAPVGTWVHWVLYNLPASTRELAEGTPTSETLANGARQGKANEEEYIEEGKKEGARHTVGWLRLPFALVFFIVFYANCISHSGAQQKANPVAA